MSFTRDRSNNLPFRQVAGRNSNWTTNIDGSVTRTLLVKDVRTGDRVPRWKEKIRRSESATSALTATYDSISSTKGNAQVTWFYVPDPTKKTTAFNSGHIWLANNIASSICFEPDPTNTSLTRCDNQARAKFYSSLRSEQQKFSAGTFFGELGETLHMLRRPAESLAKGVTGYMDALAKRKRASPKHWTKAIGGTWLEHSFGWLPFIHDMKDAAKALDSLVQPQRKTKISASYKEETDATKTGLSSVFHTDSGFNSGCTFSQRSTLRYTVSVRYTAFLRVQASMTTWDKWSLFGFNPRDVIPTVWELLPWSFFVDYFTNVGDILNSAVTDTSAVYAYARTTRKISTHYRSGSLDPNAGSPGGSFKVLSHSGGPGAVMTTRKVIGREPITGVNLPELTFSASLSTGQLLNTAALLTQARALHPQSYPNHRS